MSISKAVVLGLLIALYNIIFCEATGAPIFETWLLSTVIFTTTFWFNQ